MDGAVGFAEFGLLLVVEFDGPVLAVQERVVPAAQQQPVADVCGATGFPGFAVVDVAVARWRI